MLKYEELSEDSVNYIAIFCLCEDNINVFLEYQRTVGPGRDAGYTDNMAPRDQGSQVAVFHYPCYLKLINTALTKADYHNLYKLPIPLDFNVKI